MLQDLSLEMFPSELLVNIFRFLTPSECSIISLVCKRWHCIYTDKQLWLLYYEDHIGGLLHTHIPPRHNIYLDSFQWIVECLQGTSTPQQISFAATFGHSKLFCRLLAKHSVDPSSFQDPIYTEKSRYHRNIVQAATDLGFDEIVTATIGVCMGLEHCEKAVTDLCYMPDDLGYNAMHIASMKGRTTIMKAILSASNNPKLLNIRTAECKIPQK